MQIRFPRKIRLGFRPVYGLSIRQLLYLVVAGVAGGLIILLGSFQGASIIVRGIVGLAIVSVGLTFAFLRLGGLSLDEWLPIGLRYLMRPRRRVWRKRDVTRPAATVLKTAPFPRPQPPVVTRVGDTPPKFESAPVYNPKLVTTTVIVLLDVFVLAALGALTIYLGRGGLSQVQLTLAHIMW